MLYLGIDQHSKQLTISIRDEQGTVTERRQVSTRPERFDAFLEELCQQAELAGGFMAIVEVCGFNDWLLERLTEAGCRQVVLVHPDHRAKRKTDRRDAQALSELLWINRLRLSEDQRPRGLRRVVIPTRLEKQLRELTANRLRTGRQRTRLLNQIQGLLRRHNLGWECPTKGFQTHAVRRWLRGLTTSPRLSRLEQMQLSHWLDQWQLMDAQIAELQASIERWAPRIPAARLLRSVPGMGAYSALALAVRIGSIDRFRHPRSLGNYFGLTPGCRNSGETTHRLGSITKDGSRIARFLLGQLVLHVLKDDPGMRRWYQQVKSRRGSKIARVGVMRQLTVTLWHMLKDKKPYETSRAEQRQRQRTAQATVKKVRKVTVQS